MRHDIDSTIITFDIGEKSGKLISIHDVVYVDKSDNIKLADAMIRAYTDYLQEHSDVKFVGAIICNNDDRSDISNTKNISIVASGDKEVIDQLRYVVLSDSISIIDKIVDLPEYNDMIRSGQSIKIELSTLGL